MDDKQLHPSSPYRDINNMQPGEIVHLATGIEISFAQLTDVLADQSVIYISEQHDNIAAHQVQLQIIEAMYNRRAGNIAVGMEMFRQDVQARLDLLKSGEMSKAEFNGLFDEQWTKNWREAYQPVLDFIHKNCLKLVGLKPDRAMEDVVRAGNSDATIPSLDLDDVHHKNLYLPFFTAGRKPQNAERMYAIMCLWDEAMAKQVADFIRHNQTQLIVIAGVGHIGHGFGIPKRAFRRHAHNYTTIIPVSEHDTQNSPPLLLGDYAWKVDYVKSGGEG